MFVTEAVNFTLIVPSWPVLLKSRKMVSALQRRFRYVLVLYLLKILFFFCANGFWHLISSYPLLSY